MNFDLNEALYIFIRFCTSRACSKLIIVFSRTIKTDYMVDNIDIPLLRHIDTSFNGKRKNKISEIN